MFSTEPSKVLTRTDPPIAEAGPYWEDATPNTCGSKSRSQQSTRTRRNMLMDQTHPDVNSVLILSDQSPASTQHGAPVRHHSSSDKQVHEYRSRVQKGAKNQLLIDRTVTRPGGPACAPPGWTTRRSATQCHTDGDWNDGNICRT